MKPSTIYFLAVFVLLSCADDSEIPNNLSLEAKNLVGSWQLNGYKISVGGPLPDNFFPVENGDTFIFDFDGSYMLKSSPQLELVHSGSFEMNDDVLVLFPSNGETERFEYHVEFDDDEIVISPSGPYTCIEGCLYRYKRIN